MAEVPRRRPAATPACPPATAAAPLEWTVSAASTACCTTARCCVAPASTWPTCANTSSDDVRHIDWNVTARLQSPYVRQFTKTATSPPGSWSTCRAASTSARATSQAGATSRRLRGHAGARHHAPRQPRRRHALRHQVDTVLPPAPVAPMCSPAAPAPAAAKPQVPSPAGGTAAGRPAESRRRRDHASARWCSWCPTSSATRLGDALAPLARATRWWPCACSTREWNCPTSAW